MCTECVVHLLARLAHPHLFRPSTRSMILPTFDQVSAALIAVPTRLCCSNPEWRDERSNKTCDQYRVGLSRDDTSELRAECRLDKSVADVLAIDACQLACKSTMCALPEDCADNPNWRHERVVGDGDKRIFRCADYAVGKPGHRFCCAEQGNCPRAIPRMCSRETPAEQLAALATHSSTTSSSWAPKISCWRCWRWYRCFYGQSTWAPPYKTFYTAADHVGVHPPMVGGQRGTATMAEGRSGSFGQLDSSVEQESSSLKLSPASNTSMGTPSSDRLGSSYYQLDVGTVWSGNSRFGDGDMRSDNDSRSNLLGIAGWLEGKRQRGFDIAAATQVTLYRCLAGIAAPHWSMDSSTHNTA